MKDLHKPTLEDKEEIRDELIKDKECQVCGRHDEEVEDRFCPECRAEFERNMAEFDYERAKTEIGRLYSIDFADIAKAEKTPWFASDSYSFFLHDLAEETGNASLIAEVAIYPYKYVSLFVNWWVKNRMEKEIKS